MRARSLLRGGFHRHETHPRTPRGLADRFGVVAIVFAAFDIGFDILRRDETHCMAEHGQFASPIMRAATGFQRDARGRKLLEERDRLRTAKVDAQNWPVLLPCNVNAALDVSTPIRLYWVMDSSGLGS
jgi:hypothetical protein